MRNTKIICTLGPASDAPEIFAELCEAGLDIARLNCSHGSHEAQLRRIEMIRAEEQKLGKHIPIMLDTRGPEVRTGCFEGGKVQLADGQTFTFVPEAADQAKSATLLGDSTRVSASYPQLAEELSVGDTILVNDGLIECVVREIKKTETSGFGEIVTEVITGGELSDRKGMNFPGKILKMDFMSEQDKSDLLFGIEHGVDYVAASFMSTAENAVEMRTFLDDNGGKDIRMVAKIENQSGIDNITDIAGCVDGVMVARGDLGVEIPMVEVPAVQKQLILKCRMMGKKVIVATEMLESMIENPRPTRAEVSDIANAVYEGASAVMLSGETAAGNHPVEAVSIMAETIEATERHLSFE